MCSTDRGSELMHLFLFAHASSKVSLSTAAFLYSNTSSINPFDMAISVELTKVSFTYIRNSLNIVLLCLIFILLHNEVHDNNTFTKAVKRFSLNFLVKNGWELHKRNFGNKSRIFSHLLQIIFCRTIMKTSVNIFVLF